MYKFSSKANSDKGNKTDRADFLRSDSRSGRLSKKVGWPDFFDSQIAGRLTHMACEVRYHRESWDSNPPAKY